MRCRTITCRNTREARSGGGLPRAARHGGLLRSASLLPQRAITAVLLITAVMLLLTACDDPVGALLGLDRPQNVKATTGDYSDRIVITWDGVEDKETDDGDSNPVKRYRIERAETGTLNWSLRGHSTNTTFSDAVSPGESFDYRVRAEFEVDGFSSWSLSVTGYALDAIELLIYSEPDRTKGERSYNATSTNQWYTFSGQKGWDYRVDVSDEDTTVELFRKGNIEDALDADLNEGPTTTIYRLPRSSHYHVKLTGGTGTISVSHR